MVFLLRGNGLKVSKDLTVVSGLYHTVVMTCGISLLQGNNYFSVTKEDGAFKGMFPARVLQRSIDDLDGELEEQIERYWEKARNVLPNVHQFKESISAEYSIIEALRKQNKLSDKITIHLILTKTIGGYICETLLRMIFEKEGHRVHVQYVEMAVEKAEELKHQTAEYLKKLADALVQGEPETTCFAPIGGYKIMTALGYLAGSFLNYPMVYLHENSQILVEIPPMPLGIDEEFISGHSDFLRKCAKDLVEYESLTYQERQVAEEYPILFTKEDGYICLSAFGLFLFEHLDYGSILETKYLLSEQAAGLITRNEHHSIFIYGQLRELAKKLKSGADIRDLRHDNEFKNIDKSKVKYFLYKGASNGRDVFRCTYQYDSLNDVLHINYLWLDHDQYEKEASEGKGLYRSEKNFRDFTDEIVLKRK